MAQTIENALNGLVDQGLFAGGSTLVSDRDGDGYPEHIDIALGIASGMNSGAVWAGLINLAARLSMEACGPGMAPPVTCSAPEPGMLAVKKPSARESRAACMNKTDSGGWLLSGSSAQAMQQVLDTLAASPVSRADADVGGTGKRLPVDMDAISDLSSLADLLLQAVDSDPRGSRLALRIDLPETLSPQCGRALFSLVSAASARATELTLPLARVGKGGAGGVCLSIEENGQPEARITLQGHGLKAFGGSRELSGLIRELTRLWFETDAPGGEALEAWKGRLREAALTAAGRDLPPEMPVPHPIHRRMALKGEAERMLARAAKIPGGSGTMRFRAFIGGDVRARRDFRETLTRLLAEKGYDPEVSVLRTHKPAVSWLLEEVEPVLPDGVQSLTISIRPFSRPNCMESRARWIREIYPAPDIICDRRGWEPDRVEMVMDDTLAHRYKVKAFDDAGRQMAEFRLTPMVSELPYRLEKRTDQVAYPVAAGFEITGGDGGDEQYPVPTDRELFWRRFQDRWLPDMEAAMKQMLPGLEQQGALAFWEEIRLEVAIDENQEPLGFAEERIAPMEALHEDLYFGLLEFMTAFRQTHCPDSRIQLGRVMPLMRPARGGRPWARMKLKPMQQVLKAPLERLAIDNMGYAGGKLFVDLPGPGGHRFTARPARRATGPTPGEKVNPPDFEAIPSGDEVREWTRALAGRPGIRVWTAGRTLMGRDIVAVEAAAQGMSAGRARLLKPTLLVNARHHANEVSGTNAAMGLLHFLACEPEGAALLERANIIVVPLENGDGVATLEEMLPDCPDHKLHAARYNALGLEWYDQYFDPDSPFTEARVKNRLFRRWLPAFLLDLHGVPSHEWEQPFAGYINPRFREHWIPRSFVYAILPFYGQDSHPGGEEASKLAHAMSSALEAEPDIVELNQAIFDRYRRYAQAFEPEVYDADMAGVLVVEPTCDRISATNFANRKWPLVKTEIVTEVLDEVARGPWLERCTRAHLKVIQVVLAHMGQGKKAVLKRQETGHGVTFSWEMPEEAEMPGRPDQPEISPSR